MLMYRYSYSIVNIAKKFIAEKVLSACGFTAHISGFCIVEIHKAGGFFLD